MPHSAVDDAFNTQSASSLAQARQRPSEQLLQRVLVVLPHAVQRPVTKSLVWVRRDIQVRPFTVLQLSTGAIVLAVLWVASTSIPNFSFLELFSSVVPLRCVAFSFPSARGLADGSATAPAGCGRVICVGAGKPVTLVFCRSLRRCCLVRFTSADSVASYECLRCPSSPSLC